MEHILDTFLNDEAPLLRGFIFGLSHTAIMLLGYYSGWSINRFFKIISNGYIAGIIGAGLSHVVADIIASLLDPHFRSAVWGIAIGGILPFILIPYLEKKIIKSKHHIITGDHDDVLHDIKKKHK